MANEYIQIKDGNNDAFPKASEYSIQDVYLGYCQAIKKNGWIYVNGASWGTYTLTAGTSSWVDFTTLPEKYRPGVVIYGIGSSLDGNKTFNITIKTNGLVQYFNTHSNLDYWTYRIVYPSPPNT